MNPLEFILATAGSVLAALIKDLLTGDLKIARKEDIEQEVNQQIMKKMCQQDEKLESFRQEIIKEIYEISQRDVDLKVSSHDSIQLKNQITKPNLPLVGKNIDREINQRLKRLDEIIAQRRAEKGLSQENEENGYLTSTEEAKGESFSVLKPVNEEKVETPLSRRIKEMDERIRRIRAGELVQDE